MQKEFRLPPGTISQLDTKTIKQVRLFVAAYVVISMVFCFYECRDSIFLCEIAAVLFGATYILFWFVASSFLQYTNANQVIITNDQGITRKIEIPANPATFAQKIIAFRIRGQKGYATFVPWNKVTGITQNGTYITIKSNEYNAGRENKNYVRLPVELQNFEQLLLIIKKETGIVPA